MMKMKIRMRVMKMLSMAMISGMVCRNDDDGEDDVKYDEPHPHIGRRFRLRTPGCLPLSHPQP